MRKPFIAGNWKMFKTPAETKVFFKQLLPLIKKADIEIGICPPFINIETAINEAKGSTIGIGAQDVYWEEEGAFTGEVSPVMLENIGCKYCIVGHSERRQYFGETDETVNKKVKALLNYRITPIVCVGETLEQREQGVAEKVCATQIKEGLAGLSPQEAEKLVIAYEPIWAIGTGKTASAEDAQNIIKYIRSVLAECFGESIADKIRIQYGGSVKPGNVKELMAQPDIDGALVGGASLKAEDFAALVTYNK
jgi:triosephosphate isomerase